MNAAKAIILISFLFIGLASFQAGRLPRQRTSSFSALTADADTLKIDAETGLANDPNLMMVKSQCTACHSSKLILQHRFTRAGWQERIRWMQKYHKLWDLGESEKIVLDYLEKYYGPSSTPVKAALRRAPLKDVQWYKLDTP